MRHAASRWLPRRTAPDHVLHMTVGWAHHSAWRASPETSPSPSPFSVTRPLCPTSGKGTSASMPSLLRLEGLPSAATVPKSGGLSVPGICPGAATEARGTSCLIPQIRADPRGHRYVGGDPAAGAWQTMLVPSYRGEAWSVPGTDGLPDAGRLVSVSCATA